MVDRKAALLEEISARTRRKQQLALRSVGRAPRGAARGAEGGGLRGVEKRTRRTAGGGGLALAEVARHFTSGDCKKQTAAKTLVERPEPRLRMGKRPPPPSKARTFHKPSKVPGLPAPPQKAAYSYRSLRSRPQLSQEKNPIKVGSKMKEQRRPGISELVLYQNGRKVPDDDDDTDEDSVVINSDEDDTQEIPKVQKRFQMLGAGGKRLTSRTGDVKAKMNDVTAQNKAVKARHSHARTQYHDVTTKNNDDITRENVVTTVKPAFLTSSITDEGNDLWTRRTSYPVVESLRQTATVDPPKASTRCRYRGLGDLLIQADDLTGANKESIDRLQERLRRMHDDLGLCLDDPAVQTRRRKGTTMENQEGMMNEQEETE